MVFVVEDGMMGQLGALIMGGERKHKFPSNDILPAFTGSFSRSLMKVKVSQILDLAN